MAATVGLFVLGLGLRAREGQPPPRVDELPAPENAIDEPLQLLGPSGALRVDELTVRLPQELRPRWEDSTRAVFSIVDCPKLRPWLDGPEGQEVERLLGELRRGESTEALASLALLVQLARRTTWSSSVTRGGEHANRLGTLLQEWLDTWAERAMGDAQLYDSSLAAFLIYGRAMRVAIRAPTFGLNDGANERARRFVDELTGSGATQRTPFGDALNDRYPRAFADLLVDGDFLEACRDEARSLFPDLDGDCGE